MDEEETNFCNTALAVGQRSAEKTCSAFRFASMGSAFVEILVFRSSADVPKDSAILLPKRFSERSTRRPNLGAQLNAPILWMPSLINLFERAASRWQKHV